MELGLNLAMTHWDTGAEPNVGLAQEAERLGFSSVWTEEAYGSDAVTPLAWVGALTALIWAGFVRMALFHHVTWSINSICHMFGTKPFETKDRSTNFAPLALL